MTAPRPDLDALERLLEEAEGHASTMIGGGNDPVLRLAEAAVNALPALIAAAREREAAHDYLTRLLAACAPQCEPHPDLLGLCSQIDNLLAGMREALTAERQRAEQAEQREARLRAALRGTQEELRVHIDQAAIAAGAGVVIPAIDRALAIVDASLAEGQDG